MTHSEHKLISIAETPHQLPQSAILLSASPHLEDEEILEAMIALGLENPKSASDAIAGLVAERILRLGIPDGKNIVLPTIGLIQRSMGKPDSCCETLVGIKKQLHEALRPEARIKTGLQLGDRGTHCAAGFWGNRKIKTETTERYAREMAALGYETALGTALAHPSVSSSRLATSIVPQIRRYFGRIVRILASFGEEEIQTLAEICS